ncbi:hypothetical protein E0494_05275 [Marinilabiliaceae bacterium JC040]|nr:hypothetical protein [Marinilabiliaceae bacterium JC040]
MNEKILYTLLSVVKNNGDAKKLIHEGLSYQQIAEYTGEAINSGFIEYSDGVVQLAEKGEEKIASLDYKFKITDKNKWIKPKEKSKIKDKLPKDFIYLPHQNELYF